MFVVFSIDGPRFAALAAALLAITALLWLFWPKYVQWRLSKRKLSYEIIPQSPRKDLIISDQALSLIGPDYSYIGKMPVSFVCNRCRQPEPISLQLYHHLPSNTMLILSRHGCRSLAASEEQTMEVPVPPWRPASA